MDPFNSLQLVLVVVGIAILQPLFGDEVCSKIIIEGSQLQRNVMGVYDLDVTEKLNGRYVYNHECQLLTLSYTVDEEGEYWTVTIKHSSPVLRSFGNASEPTSTTASWRVWSAKKRTWVPDDVKVQCIDKLCKAIAFTGTSIPNKLLRGPFRLEPYVFSNRPVYRHIREEIFLYSQGLNTFSKKWIVGPHVGGHFASLYSYEQKYSPVDIKAWNILTPGKKHTSIDTSVECLDAVCGVRQVVQPDAFIVNGQAAYTGKWPWSVSLLRTDSVHKCGGALLSRRWVLTAAHCFPSVNETILAGVFDLDSPEVTSKEYKIKRVYEHPNFTTSAVPFRMIDDIALIELEQDVLFSAHVQTACLPTGNESLPFDSQPRRPGSYSNCHIIGWGMPSFQESAGGELRELPVQQLIDIDSCRRNEFEPIFSDMQWMSYTSALCVRPVNLGKMCFGDSGSPLLCEKDGRWSVLGLASWSVTLCLPTTIPSVYTDVQQYLEWIHSIMDG